ncbi:PREDICTED: uncharacterized protein LOC106811130 [Priapulus caudatus]|uniref:Uncharacterized protein LOC106811130 n=1 Tax=Priapulus caudatus TaxID=37621 RepID=A0ABM1ED86_PRICU|nr:PREDICTED: uncharacterized protein LOC106811130 [Priapulus caudatus]
MNRFHTSKKPRKVKRLVSDGRKLKTVYVRRLPPNSNIVVNETAERGDNTAETDTILLASTSASTSGVPAPRTHAERMQRLLSGWEKIREDITATRLEEMAPATTVCSMCDAADAAIKCMECGPCVYYCATCCERVHRHTLFHEPLKWNGSLYLPVDLLIYDETPDFMICLCGAIQTVVTHMYKYIISRTL